jgi:ATP-binding protein involved in chromosome partitioning
VSKVLLVASGKGGVGKSTVSANLAASLSSLGKNAGLLDADLYGPSIPRLMGLSGIKAGSKSHNGKTFLQPVMKDKIKCMSMGFLVEEDAPIVWRGLMVMKAIEQLLFQVNWSPLDVLVVDMPPGTGDTQLSICQQLIIDGVVIVTTPQELALSDARRAVAMFDKVQVPIIGLVENMSSFKCPNCSECSPLFPVGRDIPSVKRLANLPLEPSLAIRSDIGKISAHPAFASLAAQIISALNI